jgi:hypothetical protein
VASATQPGSQIEMPGVDTTEAAAPVLLQQEIAMPFGSDFQWVVPGLVLTFPGLLIVLVVVLQAVGALAWVPIARRRLGSADQPARPVARRRPTRV